jgi:hypothetical protein
MLSFSETLSLNFMHINRLMGFFFSLECVLVEFIVWLGQFSVDYISFFLKCVLVNL